MTTSCRNCAGEGWKIVGDQSIKRDCSDCLAQSLVKHKNNKMGVMSIESAKKLCGCLANDHKKHDEIGRDDTVEKINQEMKESIEEKESSIPENLYDIKKQEEMDYYTNRIKELKEMDEQVDDGVYTGTNPEFETE